MKRIKRISLTALALGAALLLTSCGGPPKSQIHKISRLLMGTLVEVSVRAQDPKEARAAAEAVCAEIKRVEDLTSFHKPSPLTSLNEKAGSGWVKVDPELFNLVADSLRFSKQTGGAFDPTVGPLSRLWRFSAGEPRVPSPEEIQKALRDVGWERVKMDPATNSISLPDPGTALDLGAIAKGYALDRAAQVVRKSSVEAALINAGGNIMAIGAKAADKPWRVGVQDPRDPKGIVAVIEIKDRAVATSGDYERFLIQDGKRYHHVLDPKTGYPAEGVRSVTIVADDGITSDALSTAVFVMGAEKGLEFVESQPGVQALIIDGEGRFRVSKGAEGIFQIQQ